MQNIESSSSRGKEHHNIDIDRPRRTIKPLTRYSIEDLATNTLIISSGNLATFHDTMVSQEKSRWIGAMVEKIRVFCIKIRLENW